MNGVKTWERQIDQMKRDEKKMRIKTKAMCEAGRNKKIKNNKGKMVKTKTSKSGHWANQDRDKA